MGSLLPCLDILFASQIFTMTVIVSSFALLGLVKAKKYNWKDSNMTLFGSDLERQVKSKYTATALV